MSLVLCYWLNGKYNYHDIEATTVPEAETEATGWLEDNAIEAYQRNEWQLQTNE